MKTMIRFLGIISLAMSLNACLIETDSYYNGLTLEQVMTDNDIWYVDFNKTTGSGNVPFLSKAFTISFLNGRLYANNNIVNIGYTGNGYGVQKGTYDTYTGLLKVSHITDGYYEFRVYVDSPDSIRLYNAYYNVTYYLEGYQINYFDFDQVFYDNIEYFLQEYYAWGKSYTSISGAPNLFDNENFLAFTPENTTTFYSSQDAVGTSISNLYWDYTGSYEIFDVNGYENLKILSLYYNPGGYEEFELVVLNDAKIELYHIESGTTYEFDGRGFIQYRLSGSAKKTEDYTERERIKVNRKSVERSSKTIER